MKSANLAGAHRRDQRQRADHGSSVRAGWGRVPGNHPQRPAQRIAVGELPQDVPRSVGLISPFNLSHEAIELRFVQLRSQFLSPGSAPDRSSGRTSAIARVVQAAIAGRPPWRAVLKRLHFGIDVSWSIAFPTKRSEIVAWPGRRACLERLDAVHLPGLGDQAVGEVQPAPALDTENAPRNSLPDAGSPSVVRLALALTSAAICSSFVRRRLTTTRA